MKKCTFGCPEHYSENCETCLGNRIEKTEAENKRLRKALEQYADDGVWISVSERLPKQGDRVLLYDAEYGKVSYHRVSVWISNGFYKDITDWMTLPIGPTIAQEALKPKG